MVTIFISTYNRFDVLMRTIWSLRKMNTPTKFVIVDNGTDDPRSRKLLDELEQRRYVVAVYRLGKVYSTAEVERNLNIALIEWRKTGPETAWVAVTDADICFEGSSPETLNAYIHLYQEIGFVAGPHLRIDTIPAGYPLRNRVIACESRILFRDTMDWVDGIPHSRCGIDTTFQLFPADKGFNRLHMNTVRVGPPYAALHLDWHMDIFNAKPSDEVYLDTASSAGSWGSGWLREIWYVYREDPVKAWQMTLHDKRQMDDLCNTGFLLSWFYQHGLGECQILESVRELRRAIPWKYTMFWDRHREWMRMIYANDFSVLGWA